MARTVYFTAATVDGFLADDEDDLAWLLRLRPDPAETPPAFDMAAFVATVGAMVMGSHTYEWVHEHEDLATHPERWTDAYGTGPCWVFTTRTLPPVSGADIRFASGPVADVLPKIDDAVERRDEHAGEHSAGSSIPAGVIWLLGGGDLVGQVDDVGRLDEIRVSIAPVTLGAGKPLLPRRIDGRLTVTGVHTDGTFVFCSYDVARAAPGARRSAGR